MTLMSHHLSTSIDDTAQHGSISASYTTGICLSVSLNPTYSSIKYWIVDSGPSISLKPIWHSAVSLPNNSSIPVRLYGDVNLNSQLILKDVLFVPQFHSSLLSVSTLIAASPPTVTFFPNHFTIQDSINKKMIGKGDRCQDRYILDVDDFNVLSIDA